MCAKYSLSVIPACPEDTEAYACGFVRDALLTRGAPSMVLLYGEVGVGKSVFARAVLRECGVRGESIPSPTFSLINEYTREDSRTPGGKVPLYHVDLYRVQTEDEMYALDLAACAAEGIVLVEWAQRFAAEHYPPRRYDVTISHTEVDDELTRTVCIAER